MLPTVMPVFELAVTKHREAASYVDGAAAQFAAGATELEPEVARTRLQLLTSRLAAQRADLTALGERLRTGQPLLAGQPVAQVGLNEALERALASLNAAQDGIRQVKSQVLVPFLPSASPGVRSALVFGGWSLLGWIVQCVLLALSGGTNPVTLILSLCGMPLLAFAAALLTLQLLGQPKQGERVAYSIKPGLVICLVAMPLAWVALIAALALSR